MQEIKTESRCAVAIGAEAISYDQLSQDIHRTRHWLGERLASGEERVAVNVRDPYWHWVCTLALLQMGKVCASVLESQRLPSGVLSLFELWLTDQPGEMPGPSLRWEAAEVRSERVPSSGSRTADAVALRLRLPASAQRWMLTSGTTGQAKVVVMSAADIQARLQAAAQQYGPDVGPQTQLLTLMGLDTIGAFLVTLLTWMRGGTVLLGTVTPSGQTNVTAALRDCNLLTASPARLKEVMDSAAGLWTGAWPGQTQRVVRVGGARLHPTVRDEALRRLACRVQTTYGSTELGLVASCDARLLDQYPGAAGRVYDNVRVEVVDDANQPVPQGQEGRVRCQSPGMALAYLGETDTPAFGDGWFYPGDRGWLTPEGVLVISGRDSDVINLGGLKFSALELESRLLHVPGVQDVCTVAVDRQAETVLAVVVVVAQGQAVEALREPMAQAIAQTLMGQPKFVLVGVPALPRNAMGKLPRGLIEQRVVQILQKRTGETTDTPAKSGGAGSPPLGARYS